MNSTISTTPALGRYRYESVGNSVTFIDGTTNMSVASIDGEYATRFLAVMEHREQDSYNCFGAADFLRGASMRLSYPENMRKIEKPVIDILKTIRSSALPLLVQVIGDAHDPILGSNGRKWKMDVAIHAGILIGHSEIDALLVLEKDGMAPMKVTPWPEMYGRYFPGTTTRIGKEIRIADMNATN